MKLKLLVIAPFLAASALSAQESVPLSLAASSVTLSGTSSLHPFTCKSTAMTAAIRVAKSSVKDLTLPRPLVSFELTVPVKSFKCEHGGLADNMYKAMKADQFPNIVYTFTSGEVASSSMDAVGTLTISGKKNVISTKVALSAASGVVHARGTQKLMMTQYGIKPPKMMMGAIKTGDQVTITFDLAAALPAQK